MRVVQGYGTYPEHSDNLHFIEGIRQCAAVVLQWKTVFPQDKVTLVCGGGIIPIVKQLISEIGYSPWDDIEEVPDNVNRKIMDYGLYTAYRWYCLRYLPSEGGIFLDPDIFVYPEGTVELKKVREDIESGKTQFLGEYYQGYFEPDITEDQKKILGIDLTGLTNMNSGFMAISGNYGTHLGNYILDLQHIARTKIEESQQMRVLEVIDGCGPKVYCRKYGIGSRVIPIECMAHTTGASLPAFVVGDLGLPGDYGEQSVLIRKKYIHQYVDYILHKKQGHSRDECLSVFLDIHKKLKESGV